VVAAKDNAGTAPAPQRGSGGDAILEVPSWVTKKVQISGRDNLRLRRVMKDKGCRYEADALRLVINAGLKAMESA
jgi:hypothetical protein